MVSDVRSKGDRPRRRSTSDRSPANKRRYRENSDKRGDRKRPVGPGRSNRFRSPSSSSSRSVSQNRRRRVRKSSRSSPSDSSSSSRSSSSSSSASESSSRSPSVKRTKPVSKLSAKSTSKPDQKRPPPKSGDSSQPARRRSPVPSSTSHRKERDVSREKPARKPVVEIPPKSRNEEPSTSSTFKKGSSPTLLPPVVKAAPTTAPAREPIKITREASPTESRKRKHTSITVTEKPVHVSQEEEQKKKPTKVIRISNLSRNINEGHLTEIFSNYGTVMRVELPLDQVLQIPRGFAYVEMKSVAEMNDAVECMDGGQIDGLCCSVLPHHGIIDHENKDSTIDKLAIPKAPNSHSGGAEVYTSSSSKASSTASGTKRRRRGSIGSSSSSQESAGEN